MSLFGYVEGDSNCDINNVILRCACVDRCELEVEKEVNVNAPNEYYFILKSKSRYDNLNIIEVIKLKLKKIWCILRGKDYTYYDIVVEEPSMKKFIESLQKLVESK